MPAPLTPRQLEQLAALNEILDAGDGMLRVAQIGAVMVGHLFVLLRLSDRSGPLVDNWNPERPGLAMRLGATGAAYVTDVMVKEGYRRLGVATALIADAAELARQHGRGQLVLHVRADNAGAIRLYERLQFARGSDASSTNPGESIEYVLTL